MEGGLCLPKFYVVAHTQICYLVCIWGSLDLIPRGGWGMRGGGRCGVVWFERRCFVLDWVCRIFVPGLIPVIESLVSPSNGRGERERGKGGGGCL